MGVSPIPDVTKGEFTVRGQDAKTRLMFDFREEPFAGVVQCSLAFTSVVAQGVVVCEVVLGGVHNDARPM